MLQKILGDSIDKRDFFLVFGLLFNVFTWYFFLLSSIDQVILRYNMEEEGLVIWGAFYLSIIAFSLIGAVVSKRFSRSKFFQFWIISGVIASLLPVFINDFTVTNLAVVSAILGATFGLGMPSCLAIFAGITKIDNRGRVGGITFLIVFLVGALLTVTFDYLSLMIIFIICAVWRGTGLIVHVIKPKKHDSPEVIKTSFVSILRNRDFLLYFVSWLMFSVVDIIENSVVRDFLSEELLNLMSFVEPIIATFFILIAGFMCDLIGRKKIILSGFVSLGAAYAIIGFLALPGDISWYLYFIVDGAAWGIFYLAFVLIIWGDLSQHSSKEKYYALGSIPFFISYVIPLFMPLPKVDINTLNVAFSVAAFFLFLAVLPLIYAPETLPEKKMELRRLRTFAEEARKAKEKYERKSVK